MIPRRPYGPARLPISFQAATHIISKRLACNVHYSAMNLAGYEPSFVAGIPPDCRFRIQVRVQRDRRRASPARTAASGNRCGGGTVPARRDYKERTTKGGYVGRTTDIYGSFGLP